MNLAAADLTGFDPRADIPALLDAARSLAAADPDGVLPQLLAALAKYHPVALAEVACGSRAPGGETLTRALLPHVEVLEKALSPRGCYPRLAELAGPAAVEVLATAARRHGAASWIVALSRRVEGERAGYTHLVAATTHPGFAAMCRTHAEAGHIEGLVAAAATTGRPEPAAALLPIRRDAALRAAAAALDTQPGSPVVAWLAAVYGPEPDPLVARIAPHLRTRAAAVALRGACAHLPISRGLLDVVIRGMGEPA